MGALPPIKRFAVDDYPKDVQNWIGTLLSPLNLLLNTLYSNLNNGITLAQNCLAQLNTLQVSGKSPTTTYLWNFSKNVAPVGVIVVNAAQIGGSSTLGAVSCQWSYTAGTITISNITGLSAQNTYNITFITFGG